MIRAFLFRWQFDGFQKASKELFNHKKGTRGVARPQATPAMAWGVATNSFVDCSNSISCSLLLISVDYVWPGA
jgi:hypothetical protein